MTDVSLYLALVVSVTALLCGHHGEGAPPGARTIARALQRHRPAWAPGPVAARQLARRARQEPT